ncbi:hypothetical protein [Butyrivibrio sp. INlla21]|uniref:hypothetical protein n=1 Tax=Butyrivibrio sp. INlla21 TaxID=1520811 RepID=UPI0008F17302|nr:hypothetical protein [Butyrivibrio sp. INlla21]SFU36956.1 hypothetical protein SAMN02910342_00283 [Butyrivibrio sp. INlla21]
MDKDVGLEIRYREKGIVSTKRAEENAWLTVEECEWLSDRQDSFEKQIKQAIAVFNRKTIHDVEVSLYRSSHGGVNEVRLALLCREYGDEENDVYTLYKYDGTATDKIKVSKAKAIKELIALERSSVVLLLDQIKMSV